MIDEKLLQEFEGQLEKKLSQGITDLQISYFDAAKIFPGGPHSKSFNYNRIDFDALKQWADKNNWEVKTAPETTHKDQKGTPNIRFTKKPL